MAHHKIEIPKKEKLIENDLIIIKNINFLAKPGEMVAIVGEIGSGKSTFVNALLGETIKIEGSVKISGKISVIT